MSALRLSAIWWDAKDFLSSLPAYLAPAVREGASRDRSGLPTSDPGPDRAVEEGIGWLCRAQDRSASADGGFARHFGLVDGWAPSYPETTGYIVPTLLASGDSALQERARRALDWLVAIQMDSGAFQGGVVGDPNRAQVVFNTGQVLLGLVAGMRTFRTPAYAEAVRRAAEWLVTHQHPDGSWRRFGGPYAPPGPKTYHTHAAWGLFEAARVSARADWGDTALANVRWAMTHQRANGWFELCCLVHDDRPLTHTLGYALRGVIEAWKYSGDKTFLAAALTTADGLMRPLGPDGFLSGRLTPDWSPASGWVCLTGTAQIAECWLLLYEATGSEKYRDAALVANRFVRRTVRMDGNPALRGAVQGSFPVWGAYNRFLFPNWACKFMVDANRREIEILTSHLPDESLRSGGDSGTGKMTERVGTDPHARRNAGS